jgi:predicted DNA-binding protein (MmcQ/YjbR family)
MAARRPRGAALRDRLRERALALPEAHEDHPWGETVAKVGKKVFVFLGADDGERPGFGVKLIESLDQALALPCAAPMGYGLGKAGWVSVRLDGELPPEGILLDWIEESYRAVAPKRLVAALDDPR